MLTGCNNKITNVPTIKSIAASPDTIAAGDTAQIRILVNAANPEDLVYYYTANGGTISGIGDTVSWKAPDKPGSYLVRVLVADNEGNQVNDSIRLVVLKNDSVALLTGIAAFPEGNDTLDLANSTVRLFTSKENWINHIAFAQTKTEGFGPIVSFRFPNAPRGTFYLDIWKDTDFGNTWNYGDYYGWLGRGDINTMDPQPFTITAGTTKDIQVQMWVAPKQ